MPPLPDGALQRRDPPGLHITYATDEFLLATKLVAQRRKDAGDIVALARRLHMENASADELEQVIYRYYTDEDSLEFILDGNDLDREIRRLAVRAERLLANIILNRPARYHLRELSIQPNVLRTAQPPVSGASRTNSSMRR